MEPLALSEHTSHDDDLAARKLRLFEGIGTLIPPSPTGADSTSSVLSDAQYTHITGWCESNGLREWGKRPRTLVILHMIGCLEAVDGFVSQALSDIALPYSEENLPRVLRGAKRAQFLAHQHRVLSEQAIDLERAGSPHSNIDGNADVHFYLHRELGSGGFGTVDHVFSRLSLQSFARKRIPRGRSFKKDQDAIRMFENELKTLKALSHRHLVRLVASYTDRKFVGLIMTPVADMDMHAYLAASKLEIPDRSIRLRRFFGCLATAVEYLHQQKIRHKDIKPQNILIKDGRVLLTDFGTSRSWADDTKGTTMGTNKQAFTKAYCAPEVAMHGTRNNSSDLWSLGCVFLEMCTVLAGKTVLEMRQFFANNGTAGSYLRDNDAAAKLWMNHLKDLSPDSDDHQVLELVPDMCNFNQEERPSATETVSLILDFEGQMYYDFCCDREQGHHESGDADTTTRFYPQSSITSTATSKAMIVAPPALDSTASDVSTARPNMPDSEGKAMRLSTTDSRDHYELARVQINNENDVVGRATIPPEPESDSATFSKLSATGETSNIVPGDSKIVATSPGEEVEEVGSSMHLSQVSNRETLRRDTPLFTRSVPRVESRSENSTQLVADVPQPLNIRGFRADDRANASYVYSRYMLPGPSKSTSNVPHQNDPSSLDSTTSRAHSDTDQRVTKIKRDFIGMEVPQERATNIQHNIEPPLGLARKQVPTATQQNVEPPVRPAGEIPKTVSDSASVFGPAPMPTSQGGQQANRNSAQLSFTSANGSLNMQLLGGDSYRQPVAPAVGGPSPLFLTVPTSRPVLIDDIPSVAAAQTANAVLYKNPQKNTAMRQWEDYKSEVLAKRPKPARHIENIGSFLFRWPHSEANDVYVTGTFDDWGKTVQLNKVGDIWEKDVELPKADEKILYKFVVNDQWISDPEAPQERDGYGNLNNVLYPEQIKPRASTILEAVTTSRAAPENTTDSSTGNPDRNGEPMTAPEPIRYVARRDGEVKLSTVSDGRHTRYERRSRDSPSYVETTRRVIDRLEPDDLTNWNSEPPGPKHKPTAFQSKNVTDFDSDASSPTELTLEHEIPPPPIKSYSVRRTRPYRERSLSPPVKKTSAFSRFINKIAGPKNPEIFSVPRTITRGTREDDDKDDTDRWSITADNGMLSV